MSAIDPREHISPGVTEPLISSSTPPNDAGGKEANPVHAPDLISTSLMSRLSSPPKIETAHRGSQEEPTADSRHVKRPGVFSEWFFEALSCIAAVAALCAIIGTAYAYHGKPKPQWPDDISVNTVVSIYTVVLKAGIGVVIASSISQLQWQWFASSAGQPLIDVVKYKDAQAGSPWGALQLLWSHHFRQPLATFGAVVTIAAFAIDPFVQQILSYNDCLAPLDSTQATLSRTNYYKDGRVKSGTNDTSDRDPSIGAINAGVIGTPYGANVFCPTGNCTFPEKFATLGYCSVCEEISDRISFPNETCSPQPCGKNVSSAKIISQLPGAIEVQSGGDVRLAVTWDDASSDFQTGLAAAEVVFNSSIPLADQGIISWIQLLIGKSTYSLQEVDPTNGSPIKGCSGNTSHPNPWRCQGYGAAQCTISPCVREYNASISIGSLREILVDTSNPFLAWGNGEANDPNHPGDTTLALLDKDCISPSERATLISQGYVLPPSDRWLPYNVTEDYENNPSTAPFTDCIYAINRTFAIGVAQRFLWDYFHGNLSGNTFGADSTTIQLDGPLALQRIYNEGSFSYTRIDEMMRNVSDSLTALIRGSGAEGVSKPAMGKVLRGTTCLNVRWGWISLPAVLVLGSIFLCVSVVSTTRAQPTWKGSPLAIIFHGPHEIGLNVPKGKLGTIIEMEDAASSLHAKLREDVDGLRLVPVETK